MKTSRIPKIIVSIIAIAILTLFVIMYIDQNKAEYLSDDTPNHVIHNYILSTNQKDYDRAFTYLSSDFTEPTFEEFQQTLSQQEDLIKNSNITIGEVSIEGDMATVQLNIRLSYQRNLLTNPDLYKKSSQLIWDNGSWKITSMPEPFWSEEWGSE